MTTEWFARVFVSALVRRCAFVLVASISMYACQARAADTHPYKDEAYTHCMSGAQTKANNTTANFTAGHPTTPATIDSVYCTFATPPSRIVTEHYKWHWMNGSTPVNTTGTGSDHGWTTDCPAGSVWNDSTKTCDEPCSLTATPLGPTTLPVPPGTPENPYLNAPNEACSGGCTFEGTLNDSSHREIDGQLYINYSTMTPTGEACSVGTPSPTTPPTDTDGDGVSDGNDGAPNNPGSTGGGGGDDGDGDGNPDGPDGDGDGNPDCGIAGKPACTDTDKNSNQSSGGGDCSSPPSSNGDQILAQIAFQTWATRCAINGMANGTPNPNGSNGDSIDLSGTNSRLDTIHGDLTATDGSGNLDEGDTTHETSPGSLFDDEPIDTELDQTGFGLSRGCPAPPTFTVAGMTRTIDTSYMCDLGDIIGALVILAGLAQAAWIFGGNR